MVLDDLRLPPNELNPAGVLAAGPVLRQEAGPGLPVRQDVDEPLGGDLGDLGSPLAKGLTCSQSARTEHSRPISVPSETSATIFPRGSSSVGGSIGLQNRRSQVRVLAAPLVAVASYVVFFLAGLGFGYAASGLWKWLPLAFPLVLFAITAFQEGVGGVAVIRLVLALLITAGGVLVGMLLERRAEGPRVAGAA
jgi:hypothetical protein